MVVVVVVVEDQIVGRREEVLFKWHEHGKHVGSPRGFSLCFDLRLQVDEDALNGITGQVIQLAASDVMHLWKLYVKVNARSLWRLPVLRQRKSRM